MSKVREQQKSFKLPGKILHQTTKAVQFEYTSPENKILKLVDWIPFSQVSQLHDDYIVITNWMARKLGVK